MQSIQLANLDVDELRTRLPSLPDYVCMETSDGSPAVRDESLVGVSDYPVLLGCRSESKTPVVGQFPITALPGLVL
jgi:hypothetical protein